MVVMALFMPATLHFNGLNRVCATSNIPNKISLIVLETQWNAWLDLGVKATKEGAGGEALGLFWIPSALDPKNETRSYAKIGHDDRAARRKNYHLLTGYKVREILVSRSRAEGVILQSRDGVGKIIINVKAKQEVVVAAGSFGSPALLQRSGIGPKDLLKGAGINIKLNLPGVGQNLQDHAASLLVYGCKRTSLLAFIH
jgi:choline dehydrogenase-like flavoprotein